MNAHSDTARPEVRIPLVPVRLDPTPPDSNEARERLRARLLKMIVANEASRKAPQPESSKPR